MDRNYKILIFGLVMVGILLTFPAPTSFSTSSGDDAPSFLMKGDLVFMDLKDDVGSKKHHFPGYSNDHVVMFLGDDYGDGNQFIESDHVGVHTRSWGEGEGFIDYYEHFTYYRVDASWNQKCAAVNFALSRIGDDYQPFSHWARKINDPDNWRPTADEWYCSELVWVAYYNCNGIGETGVDIDKNEDSRWFWGVPAVTLGVPGIELVDDIRPDDDTYEIGI